MDLVKDILIQIYEAGGLWLFLALLASMAIMQAPKAVLKKFWPETWDKDYRSWLLRVMAYAVGYWCGYKFLTIEHVHEWSILIGLFNPLLYKGIEAWAISKNKIMVLSALKIRTPKKTDKEWTPSDTQEFMAKE